MAWRRRRTRRLTVAPFWLGGLTPGARRSRRAGPWRAGRSSPGAVVQSHHLVAAERFFDDRLLFGRQLADRLEPQPQLVHRVAFIVLEDQRICASRSSSSVGSSPGADRPRRRGRSREAASALVNRFLGSTWPSALPALRGEPGQGRPGDDRSAERQLPGRGRHRALRGPLRARVMPD